MIKINLIPPEEKKDTGQGIALKLPKNLMNVLYGIPVLIVIAIVVVFYMKIENKITQMENKKAEMEIRKKELEEKIKLVNELEKKQENLKARLGVIQGLNKNRDFWKNVFVDLTDKLPEEFISFDKFLDTSDSENKKLKLTGIALSDLQVSDYISRLRTSQYIKDVTLTGTRPAKFKGREVREFDMLIMLSVPSDTTKTADTAEM